MIPGTLRRIANNIRAAIADEPDLDALGMAIRNIEAQAEMLEIGCTEDAAS